MRISVTEYTVTMRSSFCGCNLAICVELTLTTRLPSHPAQTTQRIRGFAIMRYIDLPLTMTLTTTWTSDMELGHIS